jgi:hypothetical protein
MKATQIVRDWEAVITFRTNQLMRHEELEEVRMMAMATTSRSSTWDSRGKRTGVRFWVYDNDGEARKGGEGRLVSTREPAGTGHCTMYAQVDLGSVLHTRATANARPPPAARLRRERATQP